jgi:hypothetical protein
VGLSVVQMPFCTHLIVCYELLACYVPSMTSMSTVAMRVGGCVYMGRLSFMHVYCSRGGASFHDVE